MASIDELREKLHEDLNGLCICDYISKREVYEYLDDFDKWSETAKSGDTYYAQSFSYTYEPEYEVKIWQNAEQRKSGEPMYMTPICSKTDLEAIKQECEKYDIESTGCIEIFDKDDEFEDSILIYENGEWTDLELEQEDERDEI